MQLPSLQWQATPTAAQATARYFDDCVRPASMVDDSNTLSTNLKGEGRTEGSDTALAPANKDKAIILIVNIAFSANAQPPPYTQPPRPPTGVRNVQLRILTLSHQASATRASLLLACPHNLAGMPVVVVRDDRPTSKCSAPDVAARFGLLCFAVWCT